MTATGKRFVDRIVTLHAGETSTALLMFAYSFLAMAGYNVVRPLTRSQAIDALGAENLPYALLAAVVLIGIVMQGYSRLASRVPSQSLVPLTLAGEAGLLVLFWLLFMTGAAWVSVAFYVMGLILGILLISQFWTLANGVYDARQAKRLFGFIGGGASLGGLTGAAITRAATDVVGEHNLLLVGAALLAICIAIVARIERHHAIAGDPASVEAKGVGGSEAIRLLRSSRHLQVIALVIGSAAIGAGIIEQQLNMAAETLGPSSEITKFFAEIQVYLSAIAFVVQVGLTSRIHRHLGIGVALLILPLGLGATAGLILLSGAIWAPGVARVLDGSLRYSLDKTTREVLFLPLPASTRLRAKPFIDVTVDRAAKAVGAVLLLVLVQPWGLDLEWRELSYASLTVMAVWIGLAFVARREYLRSFRRSLIDRTIAPAAVRVDVADASTIEALVLELASPDDDAVLYAIELLESLDKRNLITPLLLHHDSPRVRARALAALGAASSAVRARWVPAVERLLKDEDPDVRSAAVSALALSGDEPAAAAMGRYLDDPDPRVAAVAATVLAMSSAAEDVRRAGGRFAELLSDTRPSAARGRREVAAALAKVDRRELRLPLATLLLDQDVDVAREAIHSVRTSRVCDPIFVPALVWLLGHRVLKREARDALVASGETTVGVLAHLLHDPGEQPWVRRHIPGTLAYIHTQASMDALVAALRDPDGFLRYKALQAIEQLHRKDAALTFDRDAVEVLIVGETSQYFRFLILRQDIVQASEDVTDALVVRALDDKLRRTVDRVFRLLGLVYPWKDIAAVRTSLDQGDRRARAGAVEFLDNILAGPVRRRVVPMLEPTMPAEQVARAYSVLGTHARDLDDALAQLIHDEDAVVSAAAIQFAARHRRESLRSDIEFVVDRRSGNEGAVAEAALWALATAGSRRDPGQASTTMLPAVEVADRLRATPLFAFVSVDELFRVVASGRLCRYGPGQHLCRSGTAVDPVRFLLEGTVEWAGGGEPGEPCAAPMALGAEHVLEGRPMESSVRATTGVVCLEVDAPVLLATLGSSAPLARGVFRMLLAGGREEHAELTVTTAGKRSRADDRQEFRPIDLVFLLREHPLFRQATVEQLLDLASVVRERSLEAGTCLPVNGEPTSLYHLVEGEIRIERDGAQPRVIDAGQTVGAADVLTGVSGAWRGTVTRRARVLEVTGDDLFRLVGDHAGFLQSLFRGVLAARRGSRAVGVSNAVR